MARSSSAAPPSYAEIVTEEQRQSSLDVPAAREDLDGPLFAYIHEFRFQPPPLYSEVSNKWHGARNVPTHLPITDLATMLL